MAATKKVTIKIKSNPNYCGIGAGGIHFAYGKAVVEDGPIVNWYREHEGYEVSNAKVTDAE